MLADEQKPTLIGFLSRRVTWFNSQGVECRRVMTGNNAANVIKAFATTCGSLGPRQIRTRPYTPRSNGKAARSIPTLDRECAHGMAIPNCEARNRILPGNLALATPLRKHSLLGLTFTPEAARRKAPLTNDEPAEREQQATMEASSDIVVAVA